MRIHIESFKFFFNFSSYKFILPLYIAILIKIDINSSYMKLSQLSILFSIYNEYAIFSKPNLT